MVLLTGDPHACGLVRAGLTEPLGERLRWATDALAVEGADLLWASTDGVSVGTSEAEVLGQGASTAVPGPALDVLVRAVAAQSGRLELVDGAAVLHQGVGVLLRFDVRPRTPGG